MNWVDFIILAIFFFSIVAGFSRGFVREVISLITLIAAFVIATTFANTLATMLMNLGFVQNLLERMNSSADINAATPISYLAIAISFAILFSATVLIGAILGYMINIAFQTGILGFGNRLLGGLFGLARGFILNLVIIFILQLTPVSAEAWWVGSRFVNAYQPAVQWLGQIVSPTLSSLREKFSKTFEDATGRVKDLSEQYGSGTNGENKQSEIDPSQF